MKLTFSLFTTIFLFSFSFQACQFDKKTSSKTKESTKTGESLALLKSDLSNANYNPEVWTFENNILTANADEVLFTKEMYENFELSLEFKNEAGANSGVLVYCTDPDNWIPNSVEIQITDDYHEKWKNADPTWQCAAIFGHLAAEKKLVKQPEEWNSMVIQCKGQNITVSLNGEIVTQMNMALWTNAKTNPDGSTIPDWLSTPFAELATKGYIGFQGKHAGAKVYYRNINIRHL
jgi:hypothetical protein